ncbi:MAG TPA: ankyrin repeat domain-containing protein [Patescibacteria group bacterium]|nr:ankyrin repeat domain-containing protein [Patescibacteria group bacterium]
MPAAVFNAAADDPVTRFFKAVENGDAATVGAVLKETPAAAAWTKPVAPGDLPWGREETALMLAAGAGHTAVMKQLIDAGALLNAQQHRGWTALMYAANRNREGAVDLLLSYGADTKLANEQGDTAATVAARRQDYTLVKKINAALGSHGVRFFEGSKTALPAPPTARFRRKI